MQVTVTQFTGGKTNYVDGEAVKGISKYLLALCGKYGKTAEDILKPNISLIGSTNRYSFGNVTYNQFSRVKYFDIVATNLIGGINLSFSSIQSDFQISYDNLSWGSEFDLEINDNVFFSRVYVRFLPQSYGLINGNLSINNGTTTKIIYLSGTGV